VKDLFSPSIYPRESGMFKMTQEIGGVRRKELKKLTSNDRTELIQMTSQAIQHSQRKRQPGENSQVKFQED